MFLFEGYEILSDGSLRIANAERSDKGTYVCVARNSAGSDIVQVRLKVQGQTSANRQHTRSSTFLFDRRNFLVPPRIKPARDTFSATEGDQIRLPCSASGIPRPQVHWEKNGVALGNTDLHFRQLRNGWLAVPVVR